MCYYNSVKLVNEAFIRLANLVKPVAEFDFLVKPLVTGFDYAPYPVLKPKKGVEDVEVLQMEWGFIPSYIKNRKDLEHFRKGGVNHKTGKFDVPILTLNAIGEEVCKKPTYKQAAISRRCLVLSSGFYEWRHVFPLHKKTGLPLKTAVKYPYYISLPGREYFYMAGIWTPWTDKETGEHVESFAIVTTRANPLMEQVHNTKKRMPAILTDDLAHEWLFGDPGEERVTEIAGFQYPAEQMLAFSISKDFRSSTIPDESVNYPELPELDPV